MRSSTRSSHSTLRSLCCVIVVFFSLRAGADPADSGTADASENLGGAVAAELATAGGSEPVEGLDASAVGETETVSPTDVHHDAHEFDHEEIVVTGSPLEHDRDEMALPVDRIDRGEVLENLGATIGEILATRPGIATSGFSGGASRPVIRGQDAFRTEVTEDGLPTQDVSRESPDHAVPVNPLSTERFEVVRGPATLRYGGGANAGVVNAITNRVPDELGDSQATGQAFGAIDSVANRRDLALDLNGSGGPVAWHVDALLRRADDYEIPTGGRQRGTFVDAFAGSVGAAYFLGEKGRLGVAYSRFESNYGIPEEDEAAEIDMTTDRVRFEGDWFAPAKGLREVRVRGSYTSYEHDELVEGVVGQTFKNDQFDGRLELLHGQFLGFLGAVGMTGRWRDFEALGEAAEFLAPSSTSSVAGYFFEERALLPGVVGEFGFRVEGTNIEGIPCGSTQAPCGGTQAIDLSFVPLGGSLGLVYVPIEGLSLGLMGVAAQRAPAQVELLARGPHEATGTFEIGNPALDEETGYTGELRVAYERKRFRVESAGFFTHYDGYIFGQLTGRLVNEDGDVGQPDSVLEELVYVARSANFAGMELFGRVDLFDALGGTFGLDGQFDYVRAIFTSGANVSRIPPIRWGGDLTYRSEWMRGSFGFLRTEAQNDVGEFLTPTDAFTFLNFSLTLSLAPVFPRVPVEFTLQGRNLLDQEARNVVSFNADEVLLPGRNIRGTVNVRF